MAAGKIVLVTGATGKQGSATLRNVAKRGGFKLRAATRKPERVGYSADVPVARGALGHPTQDAPGVGKAKPPIAARVRVLRSTFGSMGFLCTEN